MSMHTLFLFAVVFSVTFVTIQSLSCMPCGKWTCPPENKLNCTGGLTLGICGCCNVCAKVEGEKCGGLWNMLGTCDDGLTCVPELASEDDSDSYYFNDRPGTCVADNVAV
jgi:hypothetical protein